MKKFSAMIVLLSALILVTSCSTETTESKSETEAETGATKILNDANTVKLEESFDIIQDGQVLNLSITEYNRDFRSLYDDNSYKQYFDYEKSFLPYVEVKDKYDDYNIFYKIKGYQRTTYRTDENGDTKVVEKSYVNRTLHTFVLTVKNTGKEDVCLNSLPYLTVIFEDEDGNEYFDTDKYCNENGETEFSMNPVYLEPSDNPESGSYDEYLKTTLKAPSSTTVTLKYVLDNDLYTSAYLCFNSENGNKYFELY